MPLTAFALVIVAAVLHALWNLTAKRVAGNVGVFWLGLVMAGLMLAPLAMVIAIEEADWGGLPYMLTTGLIHAVYFGLLAGAYRHGEMSVVYPLARGTGVAGTALAAWWLIGESISLIGSIGILSVCLGMVLIGWRELSARANPRGCVLALLVGLSSAGYSIVDKLGVGRADPVVYITGLAGFAALFMAPFVLLRYREQCREAWRERKRHSLVIGLGSMGTYLIILFAFRQANASYVVAVRELSIVVVAILSVVLLKEPITVPRCASVAAILAGVVLVKLA